MINFFGFPLRYQDIRDMGLIGLGIFVIIIAIVMVTHINEGRVKVLEQTETEAKSPIPIFDDLISTIDFPLVFLIKCDDLEFSMQIDTENKLKDLYLSKYQLPLNIFNNQTGENSEVYAKVN